MSSSLRQLFSPLLRRFCTSDGSSSASSAVSLSPPKARKLVSATKSPPDDKEERQEEGEQDEEENTAGAATVVAAKQTAEAMGATQKRKDRCVSRSDSQRRALLLNRAVSHLRQQQQSEAEIAPLRRSRLQQRRSCDVTTRSTSHSPSSVPFARSSSTPEALSKDEAKRRMLTWRKATNLRKTSSQKRD